MFGSLILAMCLGARGICTAVSGSGPTPPPPGPTPGPIQPEWGNSFVGMWYTNYSGTVSADLMPPEGDLVMVWLGGRTITVSGTMKVRGFLLVGGGGSGGYAHSNAGGRGAGAGGGAGAMHLINNNTASDKLSAGTYTIIVGKGGDPVSAAQSVGNNGDESNIKFGGAYVQRQSVELRAPGGGGGGVYNLPGRDGGCGGGGSAQSITVNAAGGSVDSFVSVNENVYGNPGGNGGKSGVSGSAKSAAAGGGGAGSAGETPTCATTSSYAGNGGDGKVSAITGVSVCYAGGGGGGHQTGVTYLGKGGAGGGGNGGWKAANNATAGTNGLGGGGGGQGYNTGASGKGGDGVVILRISGFE